MSLVQGQWFQLLYELLTVGFSLKQAVRFSAVLLPKMQPFVEQIDQRLANGLSFAQAMKPLVKIDTFYSLLLAEQHGALLNTLKSISDFRSLYQRQKRKMHGLMEYPLILLAMLLMIAAAMKGWLIPEMQSLQSTWTLPYWPILKQCLGGLLGVSLLLLMYRFDRFHHQSRIRQVEYLCRLPIIGRGFCDYYAYYLCSNLALLVQQGISEQKMVAYVKEFQTNALLHQLAIAYEQHDYDFNLMVKKYRCLPAELSLLVKCGLTNDDLAKRLQVLSQMKFKHLIRLTEHWLTMITPVMLGLIALIVLGLYLSILLPIYHSMQGVIQ